MTDQWEQQRDDQRVWDNHRDNMRTFDEVTISNREAQQTRDSSALDSSGAAWPSSGGGYSARPLSRREADRRRREPGTIEWLRERAKHWNLDGTNPQPPKPQPSWLARHKGLGVAALALGIAAIVVSQRNQDS
ncbi:hypothetical protein [Dactylosporangium darangshiense]|uniref:Uncharacterized protein n=1 Tax=Dactylosporangium darangshiense TaxID=579108 RepID=A0ABP8DW26_9ACTN